MRWLADRKMSVISFTKTESDGGEYKPYGTREEMDCFSGFR